MIEFYLLTALLVKHYVADFPLQHWPWIYSHKGEYGHAGGIAHAAIHGALTVAVFGAFGYFVPLVFVLDAFIHYHIDFTKMQLSARAGWSRYVEPTCQPHVVEHRCPEVPAHLGIFSNWFFQALGADQLLHHLTYVALVLLAT